MYEFKYVVNGVEKEAVFLHYKGHNYCDAVTTYFFEGEEGVAAAKRAAEDINSQRVHQFSDWAEVQEIPNGAVLKIVEPYDD